MLNLLQFAAMYKNLCTLEENALINEVPVNMISIDPDTGILQEDMVSASGVICAHRSILKRYFQAAFPTKAAEIYCCKSTVIWDLLREYPDLVTGIEDKIIELVVDVWQRPGFSGSQDEAAIVKLFATSNRLVEYVTETLGKEFDESFQQWLLEEEKIA